MNLDWTAIDHYFEELIQCSFQIKLKIRRTDSNSYSIIAGSKSISYAGDEIELIRLSSDPHHGEENYYSRWKRLAKNDIVAFVVGRINGLNEWSHHSYDNFKRLEPSSYEKELCLENEVYKEIQILLNALELSPIIQKSSLFFSHDIDSVHGSFLQNGLAYLKRKQLGPFITHVFRELFKNPGWLNMDQIQSLNTQYGVRTTFFWLVNKGVGADKVENADYNLNKLTRILQDVKDKGGVNALHKSSSHESFREELNKTNADLAPYNRYHFLKFRLPHAYEELVKGGIEFDSSLGFAHQYGFRNGFGLPFRPFDFERGQVLDFVEAPLHFMDGTFQKYMAVPVSQTADRVIEFYRKNETNCVLSVLWHNTFFNGPKYEGYLAEYVKLLKWVKEEEIPVDGPESLISRYWGDYD